MCVCFFANQDNYFKTLDAHMYSASVYKLMNCWGSSA